MFWSYYKWQNLLFGVDFKKKHFYDVCAHFCAPFGQNMCAFVRFLKIFDVRIFVRFLAEFCAHLSSELLDTLVNSWLCDYAHSF